LLNEPLLTCGLLTPVEIDEEERVSRKVRKGNLRAFHAKLAKPAKEIPRKPSYLTRELSNIARKDRKGNPKKADRVQGCCKSADVPADLNICHANFV
jgi:hypothetical protein